MRLTNLIDVLSPLQVVTIRTMDDFYIRNRVTVEDLCLTLETTMCQVFAIESEENIIVITICD